MTTGRTTLTNSESVVIAAIEKGVPALVEARQIIADFHDMSAGKPHRLCPCGSNVPARVLSHPSATA